MMIFDVVDLLDFPFVIIIFILIILSIYFFKYRTLSLSTADRLHPRVFLNSQLAYVFLSPKENVGLVSVALF